MAVTAHRPRQALRPSIFDPQSFADKGELVHLGLRLSQLRLEFGDPKLEMPSHILNQTDDEFTTLRN